MKQNQVRYLVGAFVVVILLLLANLIYNYKHITTFNANVGHIVSKDIPALSLTEKLLFNLSEQRSLVRSYLLSGNELDKEKYEASTRVMDQLFKELAGTPHDEQPEDIAELVKENENLKVMIDEQIFKVYDVGNPEIAQEIFRENVRPVSDILFDKLTALRDTSESSISSEGNEVVDSSKTLLLTISIVSLVIILIVITIAFITSRFISLAFRMQVKNTKELEEKNSELFQTKEQLRNIFESLEVAAFSFDLRTKTLLQLSPAMEKISGIPMRQFFENNRAWEEMVHPEDMPVYLKYRSGYLNGLKTDQEYRIIRRDGDVRWIHGFSTPIFDNNGTQIQFNGIMNDITERKLAEENQKKYEADLTVARDAALHASAVKSQFLAAMSHEIRSPLNAIIGMAEILSNTQITTQQHNYLQSLLRASDSLLQLINELLDLSKIEEGRLQLEHSRFDLLELVEKTMETMAISAHKKGLELTCDISADVPAKVIGDPDRLRQILINLVGNAIKFTAKGEIGVVVKYESTGEHAGQTIFSVSDTGIGIPEEKFEAIFDRFTQVDASTTRKYGGTGLGLTISRDLARLMSGEITVRSAVGIGSEFLLTVSLEKNDEVEAVPASFDFLQGLKILVVDDNSTNLYILSNLLTSRGAVVVEANHGYMALEKIKQANSMQDPYRFILLDYHMPDMDGLHVAKKIKEQFQDVRTTILMLSSDNVTTVVKETEKLGIDKFLVKPVKQMELLTMMKETIELKQRHSQPDARRIVQVPQSLIPLRILLVEDNEDNQLIVETMLSHTPYQLDIVNDGEQAYQKVMAKEYDLVLMDMQMPVMDGYTATREIRKWEAETGKAPVAIFALTAHALKEEKQKCLDAGCNEHLTKPISQNTLIQAIHEFSLSISNSAALDKIPVIVKANYEHLIPSYIEKRHNDIIRIKQWIEEGDYENLRILGHSLKGSGAGYGLNRISEIGAIIEQASKERYAELILRSLQDLEEYLARIDVTYQ
ncbi:response regulator [Cohnella silvisoli]|uniref:histidine kinase n=1 Tax=Cohnella silvisoli TaxID=2873699 RepID=A0ABV1KQN2_9BACL|nr:response regulator [Cohnella silvisoli]MCD9024605.1 response regulator [Cohnella silvisoli]